MGKALNPTCESNLKTRGNQFWRSSSWNQTPGGQATLTCRRRAAVSLAVAQGTTGFTRRRPTSVQSGSNAGLLYYTSWVCNHEAMEDRRNDAQTRDPSAILAPESVGQRERHRKAKATRRAHETVPRCAGGPERLNNLGIGMRTQTRPLFISFKGFRFRSRPLKNKKGGLCIPRLLLGLVTLPKPKHSSPEPRNPVSLSPTRLHPCPTRRPRINPKPQLQSPNPKP